MPIFRPIGAGGDAGGGAGEVDAIAAGTQTGSNTTVLFSNSNGITFGMSGSSRITASHDGLTSQSNQAVSASNGSFAFQTVAFSDANGITFGTSAGSIVTASLATSLSNIRLSAGTTSNLLSAFTLSNANNVSFGLDGSTLTATVTIATSLSNIRLSAGTTSNLLSAITFSNANGVTFGLDASTITASVAGGGAPAAHSIYALEALFDVDTGLSTRSQLSDALMTFRPIHLPHSMSATRFQFMRRITVDPGNSNSWTNWIGVYTISGSTASIASSTQHTYSFLMGAGSSSDWTGIRWESVPIGTMNFTPGLYYLGIGMRLSNSGGTGFITNLQRLGRIDVSLDAAAYSGAAANVSDVWAHGVRSATSSGVPVSVHVSDVQRSGNLGNRHGFYLFGTF